MKPHFPTWLGRMHQLHYKCVQLYILHEKRHLKPDTTLPSYYTARETEINKYRKEEVYK